MKREDKMERDMRRLQEAERRTHERLAAQQARVEQRFDKMRARIGKKYEKASHNQQRFIDAALELLKEDGLNNLSLRKLAAKLDMQAPALYWYFNSKEALVDFMAEAILRREFAGMQPRPPHEAWQDWLTEQMIRLRRAMLAYPDGARVVAGAHLFPAVTLAMFSEISISSLQAAGLTLQQAHDVVLTATHYTFGHVIEEQAAPTDEDIAQFDFQAFLQPYPTLAAAIQAGAVNGANADAQFERGLQFIFAGAAS